VLGMIEWAPPRGRARGLRALITSRRLLRLN
jgi:hypothetical protein